MNAEANPYQVRRATTDDLAQLTEFWKTANFGEMDLERRFTEFQVAVTPAGEIVAAVGFQVARSEGRIHSEWFSDFAMSDALRPLIWERLQIVAQNQGLFRIWTDESAPFWRKSAGFSYASSEVITRLPGDFGGGQGGWLVLQLKDEGADPALLEAQFAVYRDAEKARRDKLLERANLLRIAGTGLAVIVFLFAMGMLFWFAHRR